MQKEEGPPVDSWFGTMKFNNSSSVNVFALPIT